VNDENLSGDRGDIVVYTVAIIGEEEKEPLIVNSIGQTRGEGTICSQFS